MLASPFALISRATVTALVLAPALLAQGPSCWEPNLGAVVATGDNALSAPLQLGFNFAVPGGGTTNQVIASTNGFLWLNGNALSDDYSPTVTELLQRAPRVLAGWTDLDCDPVDDPSHGVYANLSTPGRAVVTWIGNDFDVGGSENRVFIQVTLANDGSITITHRQVDPFGGTDTLSWHDMIVGVTEGNANPNGSATDPGESDFSAGPVLGGTNPTRYERFQNPNVNPADPRDLDAVPTLRFVPNGSGGYDVTPQSCGPFADHLTYGAGCPAAVRDGAFYELFDIQNPNDLGSLAGFRLTRTATGYAVTSSNLWEPGFSSQVTWDVLGPYGAGEDSLSNQTLPFTATYGDVTTNAIQVDSNGRVFLTGSNASSWFPRITEFLADGPSIAALWTDLSPVTGGTVYFDTFPAGGGLPARGVATWSGVSEWGNAANVNTFQVQLFANGDVVVGYQQISNSAALVGFSIGDGVIDPGGIDVTAALPLTLPVQVLDEMRLDLADGPEPILNSTVQLESRGLNGSNLGVLHVGLTPQNTPLDFLGMTGCTWLASIDASIPVIVNTGVGTTTLNLTGPSSVLGASLYAQSVMLVPMLNPLQLQASNGLEIVLGRY